MLLDLAFGRKPKSDEEAKPFVSTAMLLVAVMAVWPFGMRAELAAELRRFVDAWKDARIGVAVIIGGPHVADSLMKVTGFDDIDIVSTEDAMHRDVGLCGRNCSTPLAMARLFDEFNVVLRHRSPPHGYIAGRLESCATGTDRIAKPLAGTEAVVGHKTGTGDSDGQGRIIAVNDAGYVNLSDGHRYAIAAFVADSAYDMARTSDLIAGISAIVYDAVTGRRVVICPCQNVH